MATKYTITKWCKAITDSGKDETVRSKPKELNHKFRLLDDDGCVYAYGYCSNNYSFAPLDRYEGDYGCTDIQYLENGKWESL